MSLAFKKKLYENESNKICADCHAPNPTWTSINIGCVLCIECSGIHRGLGTHISKIRSVLLDDLSEAEQTFLLSKGNRIINKEYEAKLSQNFNRPKSGDTYKLTEFITNKYEKKAYYKQLNVTNSICDSTNKVNLVGETAVNKKTLDNDFMDLISNNSSTKPSNSKVSNASIELQSEKLFDYI